MGPIAFYIAQASHDSNLIQWILSLLLLSINYRISLPLYYIAS